MALTGTLKDFGIADILQLIGQQRKSGILNVEDKDKSVQIHFVEGSIVRASSANRSRQDLLGTMMVRAEILTEAQLEQALAVQKRTLRRLGDILVSEGMVDARTFKEVHQLQTTETLFKLFSWKSGTYAFEQADVDFDPEAITPINSENALMEGFRMVDEWPMVKKRINSYEMTFRRLKPLEELEDHSGEIGENERKVYELAGEGVTVQRIIDLSRLGEFETCKALSRLVEMSILEGISASRSGRAVGGEKKLNLLVALRRAVAQVAVGAAVLAGVGILSYMTLVSDRGMSGLIVPRGVQAGVAAHSRARMKAAIEVHLLETGELPASLSDLVEAGLLREV
ncbi:MAG: DUF4388 domain-containing protein, partial [Myxococcota bacterium]